MAEEVVMVRGAWLMRLGLVVVAACGGSEAGRSGDGVEADAAVVSDAAATDATALEDDASAAATDAREDLSVADDAAPEAVADAGDADAGDADATVRPIVCDEGVDPEDPRCHDGDEDGVPDRDDLFPDDPARPGTVDDNTVYANTWAELYRIGVKTHPVELQCAFVFPDDGGTHGMTDIAIDRWGVLYGITFDRLYVIDPDSCDCTLLASLEGAWNGLTFVPIGLLDDDDDVLVGLTVGGAWARLDLVDGVAVPTSLGGLGEGRGSSGDAFSVVELGTYAIADHGEGTIDELVTVDPVDGAILEVIGPIAHYTAIYGLAGWYERAYAFDEDGDVMTIDLTTGDVELISRRDGVYWWGAGVKARIGPPDAPER